MKEPTTTKDTNPTLVMHDGRLEDQFTIIEANNQTFRLNKLTGATWSLNYDVWVRVQEPKKEN